jgi:hypothetical protein
MAQVQRVVYRYFEKQSSSYSSGVTPDPVSDGLKAIGDLIGAKLSGELGRLVKGDESVASRRYMFFDPRHRVNQVDIRSTWNYDIGWNHEIESHEYEVEYRWGVPLAHLTVFYYYMGGGLRKEKESKPLQKVLPIIRQEAEKDPFLYPISLAPGR